MLNLKYEERKTNTRKYTGSRSAYFADDARLEALGLIVSLTLNLVVLTGWIALQVTSRYDESVARALFG